MSALLTLNTGNDGTLTYEEFLREKVAFDRKFGFDVTDDDLSPVLLPHQRAIVKWAVRGGRRAIFARYGLGKSVMQLEILRLVLGGHKWRGRALIVAPLGVRGEFIRDGRDLLGMEVRFIRRTEEIDRAWSGIYVTNYESVRDGRLDVNLFDAVSLDEAAVLRSFGSKTYQEFLGLFADVPFRFVATATPSPNRHKELIHYAGFLGIMDTGAALTRFFKRDPSKAGNLTLHPHKRAEFFLWLNTWACFLQRPSDLCECTCHGHTWTSLANASAVSSATTWEKRRPEERSNASTTTEATSPETADGRPVKSKLGTLDALGSSLTTDESSLSPRGLRSSAATTSPSTPASSSSTGHQSGHSRTCCDSCRCDEGYDLPPLRVHWDEVAVDLQSEQIERDGQGVLVRGARMSLVDAAREKRDTMTARIARLMNIVKGLPAGEQFVVWCDLNDEQTFIEQSLKALSISFSSVYGALSDDAAERRLDDWREGRTQALIGKPVMLGQGLNLQQAHTAIFAGITHKFEQTVQACHRIHRYGQQHACDVHLIYAETEAEVRDVLERKWREHDELTDTMSDVLREFGLNPAAISAELTRAMGVEREVHTGNGWTVALNDSVLEARDHLEADSVGLIVTSIPFGNHYEYSPNYADMGHTDDNGHFWWQMDYLTPSLLRCLMPGRILAVHVKDRQLFGSVTGAGVYTVSPFHAEAIAHYTGHGFDYYGMITVTTDVVRENAQTYRLSYTKMLKDHTPMGVGSPEYVLLFHKPQTNRAVGWADERVVKNAADYTVGRWQIDAAAEWRDSGDRLLTVDELAQLDPETRSRLFTQQSLGTVYDYDAHVRLAETLLAKNALPGSFAALNPGSWRPDVWWDILRIDTLNSEQRRRDVENHICPFPLGIPRRLIDMYSNPGELVYDPFGGIGSTALTAVKAGRRAYSSELNPASVADSLVYLRRHDNEAAVPTLFDLLDMEGAA